MQIMTANHETRKQKPAVIVAVTIHNQIVKQSLSKGLFDDRDPAIFRMTWCWLTTRYDSNKPSRPRPGGVIMDKSDDSIQIDERTQPDPNESYNINKES